MIKHALEIITFAPADRDGTILELCRNEKEFLSIEALDNNQYRFHYENGKSFDLSRQEIERVIKAGVSFLKFYNE